MCFSLVLIICWVLAACAGWKSSGSLSSLSQINPSTQGYIIIPKTSFYLTKTGGNHDDHRLIFYVCFWVNLSYFFFLCFMSRSLSSTFFCVAFTEGFFLASGTGDKLMFDVSDATWTLFHVLWFMCLSTLHRRGLGALYFTILTRNSLFNLRLTRD